MEQREFEMLRPPRWWGPQVDPMPEYIIDKIRTEDLFALHQAKLEAVRAQLDIQLQLVGKQIEILAKYG